MVLGGLWHGAAWNFVLWGLYQGLLLAIHKFILSERSFVPHPGWAPLKGLFTFYLTCIGWMIFVTPDLSRMRFYVAKLLFFDFAPSNLGRFIPDHPLVVFLIVAFFVAHAISYRMGELSRVFAELRIPAWAAGVASGLVILYLFAAGRQESFIYFQF